jgi:iron complex transport system substrate-binding protein
VFFANGFFAPACVGAQRHIGASTVYNERIFSMFSRLTSVLLLMASLVPTVYGREIVDMAGRKVTVPDKITRLYAPSPYGAYMMYAIAPDMMTGRIFEHRGNTDKFLPPQLKGLPVIGGMGMGPNANPETLIKSHPQVLIMWKNDKNPVDERTIASLNKLNIPYVFVAADNMYDYPNAMRFLGRLLHREQRAEQMARAATRILNNTGAVVRKVPANRRPRVYYAEGVDGLSTECNDSIHTELLRLTGDVDVDRCHTSSHMGMEKISLEQVIMDRPDVIVAQEKLFYDRVYKDPAWQQVKAVREHRVYLIPHDPLNWFDRPPSFMRFLGLVWLTHCLYPNAYPVDLTREAKSFYKTFLGVTLTDQDVREIIYQ